MSGHQNPFTSARLSGGLRVHRAYRQHNGGPETARSVLVFGLVPLDKQGGFKRDLFHLDAANARELRDALDAFLAHPRLDEVGGGARRTAGDDEIYDD